MTRTTLSLLILLVYLSIGCDEKAVSTKENTSQVPSMTKEEIATQLIEGSFGKIWSNLDTSKIKDFHTDDFILLENGLLWNNDSIVNYQKNELLRMEEYGYRRQNKFEFIEVKRSGNSIWMAYDNFATWITDGEITGRAHWLESAVAVETEDGWRLEMLHSTRVNN